MESRYAALYQATSLRLLNWEVMVGIAVARMVASRATTNVVVQRDMNIRKSAMPVGYMLSSSSDGLLAVFDGGVDGFESGALELENVDSSATLSSFSNLQAMGTLSMGCGYKARQYGRQGMIKKK